jgi:hypothetical protein
MKQAISTSIQRAKPCIQLFAAILLTNCLSTADFCRQVHAASISVTTPDATHIVPKGQLTASMRINLKNDEPIPVSLAVWFISLEVVADANATGSVQFASVSQPLDYFVEGATPFGPQLVIGGPPPTIHASFSDAALLSPTGVEAAGNATVSLFDLHLSVSSDALGKFRIVMFPFDGPQPSSSSWSTGNDPGTPLQFSNTLAERTLVEINVVDVPEPTVTTMATGLLAVAFTLKLSRSRASASRRR